MPLITPTGASGGGGGVVATQLSRAVQVGGDITLNSNVAYAEIAAATGGPGAGGLDLTIAAAASDVLQVSCVFTFANVTAVTVDFDIATWVSGAAVNWLGQGAGTTNDGIFRYPTGVAGSGAFHLQYVVQAGDVTGGNVVLRPHYLTSAATNRVLARSVASGPLLFSVANLKH